MNTTFVINGQRMAVSISETGVLSVTTDKGTWTDKPYEGRRNARTDDDAARIIFDALAASGEAELYPTFEEWCVYMDCFGDTISERDPDMFAEWRQRAEDWNRISSVTINDTLNFLNSRYEL